MPRWVGPWAVQGIPGGGEPINTGDKAEKGFFSCAFDTGTYCVYLGTLTVSSFVFGVYYACPYNYYAISTYMDNVVITGTTNPPPPFPPFL